MDNEQIAKYLAGECSEQEAFAFEDWLTQSEENQTAFEHAKSLWIATGKSSVVATDTDAEWGKLFTSIQPELKINIESTPKTKVAVFPIWLKVAAALLPIGVIAAYFLFNSNLSNSSLQYVVNGTSEPMHIFLSDSSEVWLREGASARFPKKFADVARNVSLTGEAYFKVTPDANRPFVVQMGDVEVKVLGTEFNVKEEKNADVEVSVYEGKVAFYGQSIKDNRQVLTPFEKGVFNKKSASIQKMIFTDANEIAWKTGILTFESVPLSQVIPHLEKLYGVFLDVEEKAPSCEITTVFDNISLDEALEIIALSLGVEIKKDTDKIVIRGSCD